MGGLFGLELAMNRPASASNYQVFFELFLHESAISAAPAWLAPSGCKLQWLLVKNRKLSKPLPGLAFQA